MATPLPSSVRSFSFKKSLRLKIVLVLFLTILFSVITDTLLNYHLQTFLWGVIIHLPIALIGSLIILKFLKPLEQIYQGSQVLAKGELKHRFNIHTGDEIQSIAETINEMAHNLDQTLQGVSQNKDYVFSEKNRLNAVIASITDGVIVLDLHRNVVLANKAAEKTTGYSMDEMVGKPTEALFVFKDKSGAIISLKENFPVHLMDEKSEGGASNIVRLTRKDGYEVEVELTLSPIIDSIQSDLGGILILRDVTQKKVFEQMQIDFVSMASHEIRTPLTSIVNYLSVLEEETGKKLEAEHKDFLDRALVSAQQLVTLVGNLLNVSKIERGSFAVSLQSIDWKKNLTEVVENNVTSALQKNIKINLNLTPGPLPKVMVDPIRINEVINNLISNALNYTKEGGKIAVSVKVVKDELVTSIADTGVGIPPEAIANLFTKFFRVTGALQQDSKGTGLGLYISKSIIDMHHGKIWVESQVGKGSTFYFSLPLANPSLATPTITKLNAST